MIHSVDLKVKDPLLNVKPRDKWLYGNSVDHILAKHCDM